MHSPFSDRRKRVLARMPPNSAMLVGGRTVTRSHSDVDHRFRQESDLIYLTGFHEPDVIFLLRKGGDPETVLFLRDKDPERETWTGRRLGVAAAPEQLGIQRAYPIEEFAQELPALLDGIDELFYAFGQDSGFDSRVLGALHELQISERRGRRAPTRITDIRTLLHEERLIKDAEALRALREAVSVTCEAHIRAMKAAHGGMGEWEVESLIDATFRQAKGFPGYGTIVGGGVNATILHYVDNQNLLVEGALLLIDAGCEIDGFTADVTRTFPVGTKFTASQKRIYEWVLTVEKECIAMTRPGITIEDIHQHAVLRITEALLDLGLLQGQRDELIQSGAYKKFYMHRTSHWLGLDVHDVGRYTVLGKPRPLEANMVFTIEPGIYVAPTQEDAPEEFKGIGIRIEDDILVTATGHEVLTKKIPKETAELEALTARSS